LQLPCVTVILRLFTSFMLRFVESGNVELFCLVQELHLGYNSIRVITAESLACLSSLSFLDLRDNRLSRIPDEIELLQALERLDLTNNDLSTLERTFNSLFT